MATRPTTASFPKRHALALVALLAALLCVVGLQRSGAQATPPASAPPEKPATKQTAPATKQTAPATKQTAPSTPAQPAPAAASSTSANVQIVLSTVPPTTATVTWGNKRLGRATPQSPLVITRPRDSGPLDVVVRAAGFLPVQTRAHTFEDSRLEVKLTRPDQKSTLVGYRAPIDAGTPMAEDVEEVPGTGVPGTGVPGTGVPGTGVPAQGGAPATSPAVVPPPATPR